MKHTKCHLICKALSFILFKLLSKKEKRDIAYGRGQQCGDCGEDRGWLEVKEEVRGLNSSRKNIIQKKHPRNFNFTFYKN